MGANASTPRTFDQAHLAELRNREFARLKDTIFLDHAGATLYAKSHIDRCHSDLLDNVYGNPHSRNSSSRHTAEVIEQVRLRILSFFNTTPDKHSVIFTSGSTASLKLIAECFTFLSEKTYDGCSSNSSPDQGEDAASSDPRPTASRSERGGCLCYLDDNHTSVVGMRELAANRGASVFCVDEEFVHNCVEGEDQDSSSNEHGRAYDIYTPRHKTPEEDTACSSNVHNLFVYPAQSNFSGFKYPLNWSSQVQKGALSKRLGVRGNWFTAVDTASLVSTSPLDLKEKCQADFVCLSFYKMFGYPTGLGALIVRKEAEAALQKSYFGGGTVSVSITTERFHVDRPSLSERFEDGTISYLDIIALKHGFDVLEELTGPVDNVSKHTFALAQHTYNSLNALRHYNDERVVKIYSCSEYDDINTQGPIVSFNVIRADGSYVGFAAFDKLAQAQNIHVRTGCFCNVGACQKFVNLTPQQIEDNFKAGHSCGDEMDLVNGLPTGAVRVSFGYMNTLQDAETFVKFVTDCFRETADSGLMAVGSAVSPVQKQKSATLTNIYLFPVKSCAAFEVNSWEVGERGFLYDREWMIIDQNGVSLSQKREPKLGLVKPEVCLTKNALVMKCEGHDPLEVALTENHGDIKTQLCQTRVCGKTIDCLDCGPAAAAWLEGVLGYGGCKLIRQYSARQTEKDDSKSELSLANMGQILVICLASVRLLDEQIESRQGSKVGTQSLVDRFRSNLVIETDTPFIEDIWASLTVGELKLKAYGPCSRCHMICIDPITGEKSSEPLRTLSQTRGKKIPFGTLFNQEEFTNKHKLTVGDEVTNITFQESA